jgi:small conductance mechanosensitive channel
VISIARQTFVLLTCGLLLTLWPTSSPLAQETSPTDTPLDDVFPSIQNPDLKREDLGKLLVPLSEPELAKVAEIWRGYLQANLEQVALQSLGHNLAKSNLKNGRRDHLDGLFDAQSALEIKYRDILAAWKAKGADEKAMEQHELYLRAALRDTLRTIDPAALFRRLQRWVQSPDGVIEFLLKTIATGLAIWLLFLWARFSRRMAERGLARLPTVSRILRKFLLKVVYWATFFIGLLVLLGLLGVNVTPFFAVFGGLSFILGFALQQTIGNLASGLMMMILKPFDTGDTVTVAGVSGQVDELSLTCATIRTFDNQVHTIPNSRIWADVITNVSASETRRVDLVFRIDYADSTRQAIALLEEMVTADPRCLTDPEPQIFVGELADSSVNIFCRPWVKREDYWAVYWGLTGAAKERFDSEGLSIPFPRQEISFLSNRVRET